MNVTDLAKAFFRVIDQRVGPFDRPIEFRPFPFDAGGALNLLTVGKGLEQFVTYVSWDLFGHPGQKRGSLGRYELMAACDDENWCLEILTRIGRQGLQTVFEPGDTIDIGRWSQGGAALQGVFFEAGLETHIECGEQPERCGLLRCIGVTRPELEFAITHGVTALSHRLRLAGIYPATTAARESIDLSV